MKLVKQEIDESILRNVSDQVEFVTLKEVRGQVWYYVFYHVDDQTQDKLKEALE